MSISSKSLAGTCVVAMAMVLPGCGSSPAVPSAPLPGGTTVIFSDTFAVPARRGAIDSGQPLVGISRDFTIPSGGTLNATVDWSSPSNSLAAGIVVQSCSTVDGAFGGDCVQLAPRSFRGKSRSSLPRP